MLELRDVRSIGERCIRNAKGRRQVEHLFDGVVGDPGLDGRSQRRPIEKEGGILHPLGVFDHGAEVQPLLTGPASEADEPVTGGPDTWGGDESASPHRPAELIVERHRIVGEAHRQGFEHRHVDELPARIGTPVRHQDADGSEHASEPLPDLAADEDRRAVRPSTCQSRNRARPRLERELGGRVVAPWAFEPERGDRRDGQVRMRPKYLARRQRGVFCHS